MMMEPQSLERLEADELRAVLRSVLQAAAAKDQALVYKQAVIDKLTHENALLKRMKFAAQSERFNPAQKSLLDDEIEADLAAVAMLNSGASWARGKARWPVTTSAATRP